MFHYVEKSSPQDSIWVLLKTTPVKQVVLTLDEFEGIFGFITNMSHKGMMYLRGKMVVIRYAEAEGTLSLTGRYGLACEEAEEEEGETVHTEAENKLHILGEKLLAAQEYKAAARANVLAAEQEILAAQENMRASHEMLDDYEALAEDIYSTLFDPAIFASGVLIGTSHGHENQLS